MSLTAFWNRVLPSESSMNIPAVQSTSSTDASGPGLDCGASVVGWVWVDGCWVREK
jgi:hypothetical protein